MPLVNQELFDKLSDALETAGETDLLRELEAEAGLPTDYLRSGEVASLLGVSSINTVKNWLEGGHFPGAVQTPGGHWRFLRGEVEQVAARMRELDRRNADGAFSPPDSDEDVEPPLL